eukprot:TRINITY_DN22548_c0_g1_i1.p1 TRINITY_DN22548_c0_g1~~TRINITY_DN22548_c0_g1_i1.p1  ORF type:complete len:972 (+),score=111.02 TRINITY_DN22548_c0_g1_i1:62-2977(+)
MPRVPLPVVLTLLLLLLSGGAVSLVLFNMVYALESVEDVAKNLGHSISDRVLDEIIRILERPFIGIERLRKYADTGTVEIERWDGYNYQSNFEFLHQITQMNGQGSNAYFTNEYGHLSVSYTKPFEGKGYRFLQSPAKDFVVKGSPTWTIPCRYQSNCTHPSNARNHKYCLDESSVQGLEFLSKETTSPELLEEYMKWEADPRWATFAVSQNPTAPDHTYCRPNATFAKLPCPEATKGCLEFNISFFFLDNDLSWSSQTLQRDLTYFDIRARPWYREAISLPPAAKFYTDVLICASTGLPCMGAMSPYDTMVPSIDATVTEKGTGRIGVVEGYEPILTEMHAPIVKFFGEEFTRTVGRRSLSLTCDTLETCAPLTVNVLKQTTTPKRVGVLSSDFYFSELLDIARSVEVGKTGAVFFGILNENAPLLSSGYTCQAEIDDPEASCAYYTDPESKKLVLASSFNPYVGETVSGIMRTLFNPVYNTTTNSWHSSAIMQFTSITLDTEVTVSGSEYWVRFSPVATRMEGTFNLNWYVCSVIPTADYLSEVEDNATISLIVSAACIVTILVIVITSSFLSIVRPVNAMVGDFHLACEMRLDAIIDRPPSIIKEVFTLQKCFAALTQNLRLYRTFLPPSVLDDNFVEEVISLSPTDNKMSSFREADVVEVIESVSSQGSVGAVSGFSGLNVQLRQQLIQGLQKKVVSIVTVGFIIPDSCMSNAAEYVCRFCSDILTVAGRQSCMEEFRGDVMRFSWNAKTVCTTRTDPCTRAILFHGFSKKYTGVDIGIATSEATCGPMGSDNQRVKVIGIVGPCVAESFNLMYLTRALRNKLRTSILIEAKTNDMVTPYQLFELEFVDAFAGCGIEGDRLYVFNRIQEQEVKSGEWMYTLESSHVTPLNEWLAYLGGLPAPSGEGWQVPRISELTKQGVRGIDYSGECPSVSRVFPRPRLSPKNRHIVTEDRVSELVLLPPPRGHR